VLVRTERGADPAVVATAIERDVPGVTAQSRPAFADQERRLVMDMSADVISIMNAVGFIVGLMVVALTVYVATLSRRREFGALKAIGAPNRFLYGVVLSQAVLSVLVGFVVGIAFTGLLGFVVARIGLDLALSVTIASVVKVGVVAAVIAGCAAVLPIREIAGLDPAVVFRRGAAI
jgi:putative ABC transport system permease protein